MSAVNCPSGDSIRQFLLGELPEEQAESLARHLGHCTSCAQTLHGLKVDDTLLSSLRRASVDATPGPEVDRLIERFRQLADHSNATAGDETLAPQQPVGDSLDYLAPPQAADEIGRLGNYRVLKVLGAGGMGVVLLAEDIKLGRQAALKVMAPALASSAKARDRFLREARHMASIKHDHVITIYQVDEERGMPFLAMELLEGESLDERVKREGRLPIGEVLRIGREIAQGLAAAHKRGLLHRDIKPANIWLEGELEASATGGRVKILDFGLARSVREQTQLTQQGVIVGTPAYMAPEQGRGGEVDHRADLFSLGCVLYRMATGLAPFRGKDVVSTLLSVATDAPASPVSFGVPAALSELILKLLAKQPEDRPESAAAVVRALASLESSPLAAAPAADPWADIDATEPASPPQRVRSAIKRMEEPAPQAPKKRRGLMVAVAAGLLALTALAGYQLIFKTDTGTLTVDIDNDAAVRFQSGILVVYDENGKRICEIRPNGLDTKLPTGKYQIRMGEGNELKLDTNEFTMTTRGVRVRVSRAEPVPVQAAAADKSNADREVAEWVLKVGGELLVVAPPDGNQAVTVKSLPPGPFRVSRININGSEKRFTADEAVHKLRQLSSLDDLDFGRVDLTDAHLDTLTRAPGLAKLHGIEFYHTRVTDAGLAHLTRLPELRSANVFAPAGSRSITDAGLRTLAGLPSLTGLRLMHTAITDAGLAALSGKPLEILMLSQNPGVTDAGMEHVGGVKTLTQLVLDHSSIGDTGLAKLRGLTKLQILSLYGTRVSDSGLENLAGMNELQQLDVGTYVPQDGKRITDAGLARLKGLTNLTHLKLTGLGITDAGLASLKGLSKLELLSLGWTGVTDEAVPHLQGMTGLTMLSLEKTKLTADGVKKLVAAMPQCRISSDHGNFEPQSDPDRRVAEWVLSMGGTVVVTVNGQTTPVLPSGKLPVGQFKINTINLDQSAQVRAVDDAALANLSGISEIEYGLHLVGQPITDVGLERLAKIPGMAGLHQIRLVGTKVTDAGLVHLRHLSKLRNVYLREEISDAGLERLAASHPQLESLEIGSKITKKGLSALRRLKLKAFAITGNQAVTDDALDEVIRQTELESLNLTNCAITDAGVPRLRALARLQTLYLIGGKITDASIESLKGMPALIYLNITTTKFSAEGVKKLSAALPRCKIESDHGTFGPKN